MAKVDIGAPVDDKDEGGGKEPPKKEERYERPSAESLAKAKAAVLKSNPDIAKEATVDKNNVAIAVDDHVEISLPNGQKLGSGQYIGKALSEGYVLVAWQENGATFVGNFESSWIGKKA